MAGQLYRSQLETWSFLTGNNANAGTATKTDFSGGDEGISATATIVITSAGVPANVFNAYVDKGSGNELLGTYTVVGTQTITQVRDALIIAINALTSQHDIVASATSTDTITLTAPVAEGAGANTWTIAVAIINNTIEVQHNSVVPNASIFPFPVPLLDNDGDQVTATQDSNGYLVLNTGDWYLTDLKIDDWLYIQGEKRRVYWVFPSLQAIQVEYPFSVTISNEPVYISYGNQNRHIKITAVGSADTATVDNVPLKSGSFVEYNNNGGILPITYSASGANEQLKFEVGI